MKIRDKERFKRDLDIVWTNVGPFDKIAGLDLSREDENTLHEYCHFVTLGLRSRDAKSPKIMDDVSRVLGEKKKGFQTKNEIITLAVETKILSSFPEFNEDIFLDTIGSELNFPTLRVSVQRFSKRHHEEMLRHAKNVVRLIRNHANSQRKKEEKWPTLILS